MSLPPPPPPPPRPTIIDYACNDETRSAQFNNDGYEKCYEITKLSKDEAMKQVKQTALLELERVRISDTNKEPLGMLIIMTPILEPILQCGPVCGLVSLSQAAQTLKCELAPDIIFAEARRLGMTKNGEMFSVTSMQMLIQECLNYKSKIIDTNSDDTIMELGRICLQGKPALIPYDADYNHGPSLRKGHSAHWAVLHGLALPLHISDFPELFTGDSKMEDNEDIVILEPQEVSNFPKLAEKIIKLISKDSCFVIAHQGKSLRTAIWKYTDLIKSNQNLQEISPKLMSNAEDMVLEDIKLELCSKLVIIE